MKMTASILVTVLLLCSYSPYQKFYRYDYRKNQADSIKTLIIVPLDMIQARPQGTDGEQIRWLENRIASYVEDNGFNVFPSDLLVQNWNKETQHIAGFFDPSTGAIDASKIADCLMRAIGKTRKEQDVDGVLFVQLVQRPAKLMGDRVYWDGCVRKILDTHGDVITEVSWGGEMIGLSLKAQLFDRHHRIIFQSIGAIEYPFVYKSDFNERQFVWKEKLLLDGEEVREGIAIALHPFIPYQDYPVQPKYYDE